MRPGRGLRVAASVLALTGIVLSVMGPTAVGVALLVAGVAALLISYATPGAPVSNGPGPDLDDSEPEAPPREPLSGVVTVAGQEWSVAEEKRSGPGSQLLVLTDPHDPGSVMHVRPRPGDEATTLREVELHAAAPSYRWFEDAGGRRWQARIVVYTGENNREVELVKFISDRDVLEGRYRLLGGLGLRSLDELRSTLEALRTSVDGEE